MKTIQFFLSDVEFYLVFRYVWLKKGFYGRLFFQDLFTDNTKMPKIGCRRCHYWWMIMVNGLDMFAFFSSGVRPIILLQSL